MKHYMILKEERMIFEVFSSKRVLTQEYVVYDCSNNAKVRSLTSYASAQDYIANLGGRHLI